MEVSQILWVPVLVSEHPDGENQFVLLLVTTVPCPVQEQPVSVFSVPSNYAAEDSKIFTLSFLGLVKPREGDVLQFRFLSPHGHSAGAFLHKRHLGCLVLVSLSCS